MRTAKTTSSSTITTTYFATTFTTPFNITNTTTLNNTNTETVVSNNTVTTSTLSSSQTNSTTNSSVVERSQAACIPTIGYISTMTLTDQNTTSTEQMVYDGTPCNFGDSWFEPPSAILIPANTLVWTNFQLQENGSYNVGGSIHYYPFPESLGANVTVAIYLNGKLIVNSTTPVRDNPSVTNSSLVPPSNSVNNSIFALTGVTLQGGVGTQSGQASLNGANITVATIIDKPLWLAGWTPEDMSNGTGAQFGQSSGQLHGTYEWTDSGLTLPNSLPQPTTTLSFELQISGDYF